eukprot:748031_1
MMMKIEHTWCNTWLLSVLFCFVWEIRSNYSIHLHASPCYESYIYLLQYIFFDLIFGGLYDFFALITIGGSHGIGPFWLSGQYVHIFRYIILFLNQTFSVLIVVSFSILPCVCCGSCVDLNTI